MTLALSYIRVQAKKVSQTVYRFYAFQHNISFQSHREKLETYFWGCHICLLWWYIQSSHPKINLTLLLFFTGAIDAIRGRRYGLAVHRLTNIFIRYLALRSKGSQPWCPDGICVTFHCYRTFTKNICKWVHSACLRSRFEQDKLFGSVGHRTFQPFCFSVHYLAI